MAPEISCDASYRTPAHLVSIALVTPACRPSHAVNLAAHARHHRLRRARRAPRSRRACGHGWPARLTCSRHGGGAGLGDGGSAGIIVGGVAGLGDAAATEATASWGHARANEATAAWGYARDNEALA